MMFLIIVERDFPMNLVRKHPEGVRIFNSLFCLLGEAGVLFSMYLRFQKNDLGNLIGDGVLAFALFFAFIYLYKGSGKRAAIYYKSALYLFLLSSLITVVVSFMHRNRTSPSFVVASAVVALIGFILVALVAFVPNLGKKRSLYLCGANYCLREFVFVIVLLLMFFVPSGAYDRSLSVVIKPFAEAVLSAIIYINTVYKYIDKENRHTV